MKTYPHIFYGLFFYFSFIVNFLMMSKLALKNSEKLADIDKNVETVMYEIKTKLNAKYGPLIKKNTKTQQFYEQKLAKLYNQEEVYNERIANLTQETERLKNQLEDLSLQSTTCSKNDQNPLKNLENEKEKINRKIFDLKSAKLKEQGKTSDVTVIHARKSVKEEEELKKYISDLQEDDKTVAEEISGLRKGQKELIDEIKGLTNKKQELTDTFDALVAVEAVYAGTSDYKEMFTDQLLELKKLFSIGEPSEDNSLCSICFESLSNLPTQQLKCTHIFCYMCIDDWSNKNPGALTCPTCRGVDTNFEFPQLKR